MNNPAPAPIITCTRINRNIGLNTNTLPAKRRLLLKLGRAALELGRGRILFSFSRNKGMRLGTAIAPAKSRAN